MRESAEMFSRPCRCRIRRLHRQPLIHLILPLATPQWFCVPPPSWHTLGALTNCFCEGAGRRSWTGTSPWTTRDPSLMRTEGWHCSGCSHLLPSCAPCCEGVNKSMPAPISVSSVSEASALAFCCVIYARLLLKMSSLPDCTLRSPTCLESQCLH